MSDTARTTASERWDKNRVEIFSDGVFAIAITLLVLEIKIEPDEYHDLAHALVHQWPAYLGYVISFLTVGSVWIAHHGLFSRLRYVDGVLLRLNLLLLMTAAFLPFPTSVFAQAFHESRGAQRTAVIFYGLAAVLIELLLSAAVRYAAERPALVVPGAPPLPPRVKRRGWLSALLYLAGVVVGIVLFPRLAAAAYLLVAVRGVFVSGGEGRFGLTSLRRR